MLAPSVRPAQQARSRRTQARLLEAAEEVLAERGLEGAAIPEIAKRAGVSPASIYRRFSDKDGLMRHVFEEFFARSIAANRAALDPARWKCATLAASVSTLVCGMVAAYRQKRGLLRAVITYAEQHPSIAFRRRARELRRQSAAAIEKVILRHASEIKHPRPKRAVKFALQMVMLALKEHVSSLDQSGGSEVSDHELRRELARMFLGYLNCRTATNPITRRVSLRLGDPPTSPVSGLTRPD